MNDYDKMIFDDANDPNFDWKKPSRISTWANWKGYVGDYVRAIWDSFTPEQRFAIARDAEDAATHDDLVED